MNNINLKTNLMNRINKNNSAKFQNNINPQIKSTNCTKNNLP